MRRLTALLITSIVATLFAIGGAAPAAQAHDGKYLDGEYYYHDIVDRSALRLWISGNNGRATMYDEAGSVCRDAGLGFVPALHFGPMVETSATTWDVTGHLWCQTKAGWVPVIKSLTITYESEHDSAIFDHTGQPYKHLAHR